MTSPSSQQGGGYTAFICPVHGILSQREADDCVIEGHDGTEFGRTPDGDPYTGEFFCDLPDYSKPLCEPLNQPGFIGHERCHARLREAQLAEVDPLTGERS